MSVSISELQINLVKYLKLSETEDINITENGKVIASLTAPRTLPDDDLRGSPLDFLCGLLKDAPRDIDLDRLREERLSKYEDNG